MEQACTPTSGSTLASHVKKCLYITKSGAAETRQQSTPQLYLMAAALSVSAPSVVQPVGVVVFALAMKYAIFIAFCCLANALKQGTMKELKAETPHYREYSIWGIIWG